MKTKILASFFILVALSACDYSPYGFPLFGDFEINFTFRINGTVTDATDNSPVKKAFVALHEKSTGGGFIDSCYTGAEGRYRIVATTSTIIILEEHYFLHVRATGYKERYIYSDEKKHVRITEELQTIDIQLEPE